MASVKRRVWTPAKKARVLAYIDKHGRTAAMAHFRLSGSMVYNWQAAARAGANPSLDKDKLEWVKNPEGGLVLTNRKHISHAALLYLRSAKRAGPTAKGHLLAMLALEELEGR